MKELTERTRKVQERHNQITCNNSVYQTGECKLPRQTTMEHPIEHMEVLDDYELIETDQQTEVANLGDDDFIEIDRGPNFSIENETVQPRVTPDDIDLDLDSETVSPPKATTSALPNHIVVGSEDEQPEATTRLSRLLLEHEKRLLHISYNSQIFRLITKQSQITCILEIQVVPFRQIVTLR